MKDMSSDIYYQQFARTRLVLGSDALEKLKSSRVAVFGLGGVGGYVCEALVRSGVCSFDIVDNDTVSISNLNRQIIATHSSLGRYKTELMKERMLDINPQVHVTEHRCFFLPSNSDDFHFEDYDYVVDAVDTVTAKLEIIMKAKAAEVPVISSMGTGNKTDPGRLRIADISETRICPLARVMRKELKKRGIYSLKVLYSDEEVKRAEGEGICIPEEALSEEGFGNKKRSIPGSTAFVPPSAGLLIAAEIVKDLTQTGQV